MNIHLNTDVTTINMNKEERGNHVLHIIMTQYALKTGIITFKEIVEA